MKYAAATDIGKKCDHNEDFYILPEPNEKYDIMAIDRKRGKLFILCDGIGGSRAGEVASELAASWTFREFYGNSTQQDLAGIIVDVNRRLFDLSSKWEQYRGMGTTMVTALFRKGTLNICSVGDSRAYRFRERELYQITEDQSEVWNLYKIGEITKDEIRSHPRNTIVTEALGTKKDLTVDTINKYKENINKGDLFLLSSDGLTDMVCESDIKRILEGNLSLGNKAKALVDMANNNGGKDNITVILINT